MLSTTPYQFICIFFGTTKEYMMNTKELCFSLLCSEDCTINIWNTADVTEQCIGMYIKGQTDTVMTIDFVYFLFVSKS